jgi:hypothetical protein
MECKASRSLLFRKMDDELSPSEAEQLDSHLLLCSSCAREFNLLLLPRRIAQTFPILEPSPYFYSRLKARIQSEDQAVTIWQIILGLSRHVVPTLAAITLIVLGLFAYFEIRDPMADVFYAYDRIFISGDRPHRMVIADQGEITDESVLFAISEQDHHPTIGPLTPGKK